MTDPSIVLPKDKGWTRLGPGGGGSIYLPTVSPHDPNTAIVTCDMTGQYITRDGGRTWHMSNLMIWCNCFAFDPVDPARIYAGANALYATDDFGQSWEMIWPGPKAKRQAHLVGDEASPVYVGKGWPGGRVTALAIDPRDNARILAGLSPARGERAADKAAIYASTDRGKTWSELSSLAGARLHYIIMDPRSDIVWAITSSHLYRSEDRAKSWQEVPHGSARPIVAGAVGFPAEGGTLLYVITAPADEEPSGLFVSADEGRSWSHAGAGVQKAVTRQGRVWGAPVRAVGVCRDQPHVAYLAVSIDVPPKDPHAKRQVGIAKTTDGGKTWQWVLCAGVDQEPGNLDPDWLTKAYGSMWPDYPFGLGVSATDPDICYATDMGRAVKTADGGARWDRLINDFDSDGGAYTRGLDVTTCYGLHFDPHHPDVAFISYTDIGLHKTNNRGLSWHHRIRGVPRRWRNTCYWLAFDPEVPGRIWSVWSGGHDYPRLKMFRSRDARSFRGGVCVSDDNGETWQATMAGMPEVGCTHIVLDPSSPADLRTLYVTVFGRGVYKSVDNGDTWNLCPNGLPEDNLNAWRLVGDPSGVFYLLITRNFREGQSVPGGIYRTTDGASTWERLKISDEIPFPNDLCLAPDKPDVMYAAGWPVALPERVVEGGIFKTADRGNTWQRLPFPGCYVYAITIDPREPEVIYATAWYHGVFRSEDGGTSWSRLGGANFGWPHRVIPDPFHPENIYLTTFGASLWHGPKTGVPGLGPDVVDLPPVSEVRP